MTPEDYKKQHPEHKHLEGNALWDAMENAMLHQQSGQAYITHLLPWYKRYKLRYLFYVRKPNCITIKPEEYEKVCANCKKGSSIRFMILDFANGTGERLEFCAHCSKPLIEIPNTSVLYYWLTFKKKLKKLGWQILEFTHLFRYSIDGRYDLFGDESHYVRSWLIKSDGTQTPIFRDRKWWEYIVIEKR